MLITRPSMLTGDLHTMDLPVTEEDLQRWKLGGLSVQNAFPHLTPAQREFMLSGSTQEEWDAVFADPEDL